MSPVVGLVALPGVDSRPAICTQRFEWRADFTARKKAEKAEQAEKSPQAHPARGNKAKAAAPTPTANEAGAEAAAVDPAQAMQDAMDSLQMAPGTVVVFQLGDGAEEVLHEDMKDAFSAFGVKYVDLPRGATTGYARFESAEVAAEAASAALEGLEAGGKPLAACFVLPNDDIGAYALKAFAQLKASKEELLKKRAEQKKAARAGGRGRGAAWRGGRGWGGRRGGGGGGRGGKRTRDGDGGDKPAAKKPAQ
jgi:hypothetical protein